MRSISDSMIAYPILVVKVASVWMKWNSFHCICDPGFTGELCQTNVDDCVGVDCSGNGRCVDGVNNFTCECARGFSGPLCSESGTYDLVC